MPPSRFASKPTIEEPKTEEPKKTPTPAPEPQPAPTKTEEPKKAAKAKEPDPDPRSIKAAPAQYRQILEAKRADHAKATTDLANAHTEGNAWGALSGHPTLDQGAKDAFVEPNRSYWANEIVRLRSTVATLTREIAFLETLLKIVDERSTQPVG